MSEVTKFGTAAITEAVLIVREMLITNLSVVVQSGTCDILGSEEVTGITKGPITRSAGQSFTVPANGPNAPIDGVLITPTGTTNLLFTR